MNKPLPPLSTVATSFKLGNYQHFKGDKYCALFVARDSETLEEMVVYQGLYGENPVFVRPLANFTEQIERPEYCGPRFVYIGK